MPRSGDTILICFCHIRSEPDGDASRQLLRRAAARCAPEHPEEVFSRVERSESGKPYFPDAPDVCFSITHSGDFWLCALSPRPVGLDLQQHRPLRSMQRIMERWFHPGERAFVARTGVSGFHTVWAAKESYVKYTGQGILQGRMADFSVACADGMLGSIGSVRLTLLPFCEGYSLCLCAEADFEVRIRPL